MKLTMAPMPRWIHSSISSIHWQLDTIPTMCYQPMDKLSSHQSHLSKPQELAQLFDYDEELSTDVTTSSFISNLIDILTTTSHQEGINNYSTFSSVLTKQLQVSESLNIISRRQYAILSLALILLGNGFIDEAHNLVTPLSWSEPTHFGYIHNSALPSLSSQEQSSERDKSTNAMASYIHGLIHRYESFSIGEYNMNGYQNSNYWTNTALSYAECTNVIPFRIIRDSVLQLASLPHLSSSTIVQQWCQERIVDEGYSLDPSYHDYWESRALTELCANVISTRRSQMSEKVNPLNNDDLDVLQLFVENAAEIEVKALLRTCLETLGYECSSISLLDLQHRSNDECDHSNNNTFIQEEEGHDSPSVNDNIAISAANKISSAHFESYQSNGFIVLRRMKVENNGGDDSKRDAAYDISIAAGTASRLLDSSACRVIDTTSIEKESIDGKIIKVGIVIESNDNHTNIQQNESIDIRISDQDCVSLLIGDAISVDIQKMRHFPNIDQLVSTSSSANIQWFSFVPHDESDKGIATFTNPLYGSKGETPTTVVQWSKGTIF